MSNDPTFVAGTVAGAAIVGGLLVKFVPVLAAWVARPTAPAPVAAADVERRLVSIETQAAANAAQEPASAFVVQADQRPIGQQGVGLQ